jgi:hypothetical protein
MKYTLIVAMLLTAVSPYSSAHSLPRCIPPISNEGWAPEIVQLTPELTANKIEIKALPKVNYASLEGQFPYQYKFSIYAAEGMAARVGGFSKVERYKGNTVDSFSKNVKAGDRLTVGVINKGTFRFTVIQRTDSELLLWDLVTRSYYKATINQLVENGELNWSPAAHTPTSKDIAVISGFERVSPDQHLEFYNGLRAGDELMFFSSETNKWTNLVYHTQSSTVRVFDYIHQPTGSGSSFKDRHLKPEELFNLISSGSLYVKRNPTPIKPDTIDSEIYPTLSVGMLAREAEVTKAASNVIGQMSRMDQSRAGMSDSASARVATDVFSMGIQMSTMALENKNELRRRELRSIRAMRGMSDATPFNPNLLAYDSHETDVDKIEPTLPGKALQIDIFVEPGKSVIKDLSVRDGGANLIYSVPVESLTEARFVFAQLMEAAYGAVLSNRYMWAPNNIFDHRYTMQSATDPDTTMTSPKGYYTGRFVTVDGHSHLEIVKEKAKDQYLPNFNLLAGMVWGQGLRMRGGP